MSKSSKIDNPLFAEERTASIQRFIETNRRTTVNEISAEFHISESTVRRDLIELDHLGLVRRFRGGAKSKADAPIDGPILDRAGNHMEEKRAIGALAASLVNEGDTIFLGSGTSVLEVAKQLSTCHNLTIITNSLIVLNVIYKAPNVTVVCPGGILRTDELSMIGHICEQSLQELRADKVIMGIKAIDIENGLTSDHLPEILTDRSILRLTSKVILVADHTKLGKISSIVVGPITSIDTLVTDRLAPPDFVKKLQSRDISVLLA